MTPMHPTAFPLSLDDLWDDLQGLIAHFVAFELVIGDHF